MAWPHLTYRIFLPTLKPHVSFYSSPGVRWSSITQDLFCKKRWNFLTRRMAHGCPRTMSTHKQNQWHPEPYSHVTTETVMTQFCDCQIVSGTLMKLPHPTRGKQKTTCWSPPVRRYRASFDFFRFSGTGSSIAWFFLEIWTACRIMTITRRTETVAKTGRRWTHWKSPILIDSSNTFQQFVRYREFRHAT